VPARPFQSLSPLGVIVSLNGMLTTVKFNDQARFAAGKICESTRRSGAAAET
jgi:hypothetical protein